MSSICLLEEGWEQSTFFIFMTGFPGLNSTFRMSDLERGAERASCATMHSTDFPCIWRLGDRSNKDSSIPLSELRSWLYPLNLKKALLYAVMGGWLWLVGNLRRVLYVLKPNDFYCSDFSDGNSESNLVLTPQLSLKFAPIFEKIRIKMQKKWVTNQERTVFFYTIQTTIQTNIWKNFFLENLKTSNWSSDAWTASEGLEIDQYS